MDGSKYWLPKERNTGLFFLGFDSFTVYSFNQHEWVQALLSNRMHIIHGLEALPPHSASPCFTALSVLSFKPPRAISRQGNRSPCQGRELTQGGKGFVLHEILVVYALPRCGFVQWSHLAKLNAPFQIQCFLGAQCEISKSGHENVSIAEEAGCPFVFLIRTATCVMCQENSKHFQFISFNPQNITEERYNHFHFRDEEIEAQRY